MLQLLKLNISGSSQVEVLAGTLLTLVEERLYQHGNSKLILEIIDQENTVLESCIDDLSPLTYIQFELLRTVPSCSDRLLVFHDRQWLHEGESLKVGDKVQVQIKGHHNSLSGIIRFKGSLDGCIYFGVELLNGRGSGTSDGVFRKVRYFTTHENNAVFVGINKLHRDKTMRPYGEEASASAACAPSQVTDTASPRLKLGERIVWISDIGPECGVVKWIGKLPHAQNPEDITVGVEFDNPVGSGTGKYKDQRLFTAKQNHASLVPILGLMTEREFLNQKSQNEDEADVQQLVAITDQGADTGKSRKVIEEQQALFEQFQPQEPDPQKLLPEADQMYTFPKKQKQNFVPAPDYPIYHHEHPQMELARPSNRSKASAPILWSSGQSFEQEVTVPSHLARPLHKSAPPEYFDKERTVMNPLYEHQKLEEYVQIQPSTLAAPTNHDLHTLSQYIYTNHISLASCLGLSSSDVEKIQSNAGALSDQVFLILSTWKDRSKRPTFEELSEALIKSDIDPNVLFKLDSYSVGFKSAEQPHSGGSLGRGRNSLKSTTSIDPDLGIGSMVEVMHNPPWYGVIRWIGHLADQKDPTKPIAGLEMDKEISAGTDGTFQQRRLFQCGPRRAFFVPLYKCRKDKRFVDQESRQSVFKGSGNFGNFETPDVFGTVSPPDSLDGLCGKNRGIQGHHNSCYLDSTLFAMFFFTTVFDSILYRPRRNDDLKEYEDVIKVLKEGIVNPLRKFFYVRADKVMKLRQLLDKLGNIAGMMTEEKDPEEFLDSFLHQITKADPLLQISSGDGQTQQAYFYQLIMEKDEKLVLPTTQQLFELSFLQMDIKLKEIPSCLIIQMPRFGKDYKMYRRIMPSLELDITDVLEDAPRECIICGDLAAYECSQCYQIHGAGLNTIAFCEQCKVTSHQHKNRQGHKPRPIKVPALFKEFHYKQKQKSSLTIEREKMELFAVVCIQTSHYVSFVKCGQGIEAPWVFFDSMADRMGEQSGYNIPEVTFCEDLPKWLSETYQNEIMKEADDKNLPEHMRRLLCDAYMCLYQSPDVMMHK
ncbi:hypothetical protein ScPMuIL_001448 [Solemya velum]